MNRGDTMQRETVEVTLSQQVELLAMYHTLDWDLRHKTRNSQSLTKLSKLFSRKFKTKLEAFNFLHDLFKANDIDTLDICEMGDCPDIAERGVPAKSIGKYLMSWDTGDGITTEKVRLCVVCHRDMKEMNVLREDKS
jgi:hypothetical protein